MTKPHYDNIAKQYQILLQMPIFEMISYTLDHHLGDVMGKSVLDLACGEGFHTRRLKQLGAGLTVGVDVSTEMISLARQAEATEPLGIDYRVNAVQNLGLIGQFDLITAAFLLHYAPSKTELLALCQTAANNLKPGGRFIAMINPGRGIDQLATTYETYGYKQEVVSPPLQEGSNIKIMLTTAEAMTDFDIYYYTQATYEATLKRAGFHTVTWHPMILPSHLATGQDVAYWQMFLDPAISPIAVITGQK